MVNERMAALVCLALTGCGAVGERIPDFLRPVQPPRPQATATGMPIEAEGTILLPGPAEITTERGLRGVILRVAGTAPSQGFHAAELRPLGAVGGIAGFEFRAAPPPLPQEVGPARTRRVTAAVFFSNLELRDLAAARIVTGTSRTDVPLR